MKTNSIKLVFYNSLIDKTICQNKVVFWGCFPFSLIPPWLYILLLDNLDASFTFFFSINKANFLDNSTMLSGVLMSCKLDSIVSAIFPCFHKSAVFSSTFRWSFALNASLSFWRRSLGMICMTLELSFQMFISFVISIMYLQ